MLLERPDGEAVTAAEAAEVALGITLRAYSFEKYKTKKKKDDEEEAPKRRRFAIATANSAAAERAWAAASAVGEGVAFARDLVNEPANALGPVEFADRLKELAKLGVDVKVLGEPELRRQKMGALLGVSQGSERPPRVVVMHWWGGREKDSPLAFVGKGVVFDTGGISIKPAAGMEDMKGDMGGAAAVSGLMRALALRKAKVNAVGIVGLVENMPDGKAQRPGDIVTSMSGQTIEVLNTDAEGRLVLADLLTYVQKSDKPAVIIDLATLTGAILVALGSQHAGLFSNNDTLAKELSEAGKATGEKVWRMPLGSEYDKMIDSKIADMKNIGGRNAGSITGRAVHPALRRERYAVGASRRRRHRHGLAGKRDQPVVGLGLGGPAARRVRARAVRAAARLTAALRWRRFSSTTWSGSRWRRRFPGCCSGASSAAGAWW